MITNLERFKNDLTKLIALGHEMILDLDCRNRSRTGKLNKEDQEVAKKIKDSFEGNYQRWYTEACSLLKQLIPDRLQEFTHLYHGDGKRKQVNATTYSIQDWLTGLRSGEDIYNKKHYDDFGIIVMRFNTQLSILKSVKTRFESSLFDLVQLVRADLFDSELDAARELVKNGFLRGGGAIAGVVMEKHLAQVCASHNIPTRKLHPTISDFNDLLKNGGVLDVPAWRQIQRLGDIRNLCDHNKNREPTDAEVIELIDGVEKLSKTLF